MNWSQLSAIHWEKKHQNVCVLVWQFPVVYCVVWHVCLIHVCVCVCAQLGTFWTCLTKRQCPETVVTCSESSAMKCRRCSGNWCSLIKTAVMYRLQHFYSCVLLCMSSVYVYRKPRQFTVKTFFGQFGLLQHNLLVFLNATFDDGNLRPEGQWVTRWTINGREERLLYAVPVLPRMMKQMSQLKN